MAIVKYKNKDGQWVTITSMAGHITYDDSDLRKKIAEKQDEIISGVHIHTINGNSIVGPGNLIIPKGEKGEPGPAGPQGGGYIIKGFVDDSTKLPSLKSTLGDAYVVGTKEPYELHMFNGSTFVKIGPLNQLSTYCGNIDGGRADSTYGDAQSFDCGGAAI